MKLEAVRKFALSLPHTTEEPHHNFASFRVQGKIFVTVPPDQEHIHVFVEEATRETALALEPEFVEKLLWGNKVLGLRVKLAPAKQSTVLALVQNAYENKAPKARAKPARGRNGS